MSNQLTANLPEEVKENMADLVILETFKQYKAILKNEKLRPMITEALYRKGYDKHMQHTIIQVDNSCMAKDIIQILEQIIFILNNEEDNQISKKYKHVKSK